MRDGRLHVAPVKATTTPEVRAFADGIEAMMPPARITELLSQPAVISGCPCVMSGFKDGLIATE